MEDFRIRTTMADNDVTLYETGKADGEVFNQHITVFWELDLDIRSRFIKHIGIHVPEISGFVEYYIDTELQTTETIDISDWEIEVNDDGVVFNSSITVYDVELWMASKKIVVNFE